MKTIIIITASLFSTLCYLAHHAEAKFIKAQASIDTTPSIKLLLLDSSTVIDTKQAEEGKSFVLLYFSPDCPFCQQQIADLLNNSTALSHVNFYLLSFSPLADLRLFYEKAKLAKYKNFIVAQDIQYKFYQYFHPEAFPCLAIYNQHKLLVKLYRNETTAGKIISTTKL
jgi:hypothetical protein